MMKSKGPAKIKNIILISILSLICFFAGIFLLQNHLKIKGTQDFVFAEDEVEWKVEHYIQNLNFGADFDENDYELFEEEVLSDLPNTNQTATPIEIEGFEFDSENSVCSAVISGDETTIIKLFYTRQSYSLTVSADDGFSEFLIDDQNVSSLTILFGQQVKISNTLNEHKAFLCYEAFKTDDSDVVFEILENTFSMPAFDLTVNLKSEIEKFSIKIKKVFYENKTDRSEQFFSELKIPYNGGGSITIEESSGYHLYQVDGNYYSSTNSNVDFDASSMLLSISNVDSADEVYVYFEKDFNEIAICYGTNSEKNNFAGGTITLCGDNSGIFDISITQSVCTAYVYVGSQIQLNYLANNGYRFYSTTIADENGYDTGYESCQAENGTITITNVYDKISIKVLFLKTYLMTGKIQSLQIGAENKKIAKIAFDEETAVYDDAQRIIDEGLNVELNVTIDSEYASAYEVKKWIITDDFGNEIDYDEYEIHYYDGHSKIIVNTIYKNLTFTAVFGKKIVSVQIAWNGLFGTVQSNEIGDDYRYDLDYGSNISFTLKAIDKMHFLKVLQMNQTVSQNSNENVFARIYDSETQNNTQTNNQTESFQNSGEVIKFSISNITENITVNVQFVSDTWWEHIETNHGFFGNGTPQIPYIIRNTEDLALLSFYINTDVKAIPSTVDYDKAYYLLATDLDVGSDYFYVPIGTEDHPFNGTFDYNFFKIENMLIENQTLDYQYDGVFYTIGEYGRIINQTRSYLLVVLMVILVLVIIIVAILLVLLIEKRVKPPKRIITIKEYMARKNTKNLQDLDISKFGENTGKNSKENKTNIDKKNE